ncbi:PC4 and SFRS1-interacting protein [Sparganum proliferum]
MDFLLSVYPNADAESKQSRLIPLPSPSSGVSPRSVGNNSLGDDDTKSEKVSSSHVTGCTDNETDLSQSGASDDDDSYVPKTKSQKKRTDASSQPSVKRSAPRRKPAKEVSSARSVQKAGAKRPAHQASHPSVSSGTKKRRQASSSTVDDANERASLSSISSISDDEEDPLASWQKADAARKSEIEVKLQELEKRRQQEEEKAIRQAKKHISKSKQRNSRKHSDRQSTSPRPTSSLSTDLVKSEPETEGISVPTVASPHASSVTSDSESAVQKSRESKEARRMAKRLMKKEAKREAKKADKRNAKRLEKALRKQQQIQQLAQLEEQEDIVKDEDAGVETFLEDAATVAGDNASEVSGDDAATFAPVVKDGDRTTTVEDAMTAKDFVGSPTEESPTLSAPIEHSPLSATSVSSSKHQLSSYSRSPELTPSHPVPTEEAARVHTSPTSLTDEPVDGRLHRHYHSPTSPSTPPESDNQMSPTTVIPSQQSQKQQSPSSDQNIPSVTSPVVETPPPVADAHSPNLSTSPHESDEDVRSGHRRRRDQPSSHRKRRLNRVSSASSQSEEEENRVSDKEIEKHPSHHRHHGKLARTDGHVANGDNKGTVEAREHSQKTANGGLERKRAATPDCLQQLRNLNRQLKASLLRGRDDHANALAIFDQICAVPATLVQLTQASDLTDCVKKCRRYKLSAEVRDKAQQVLAHFHSIQAAASPEEVQQAMAIVAERVKQAKMSQTASVPINQDENSQGSPAVATGVVSQAHVGADTPSATATAPRAISPTRYWEEKRASIKAELDERANSVLSMIRATEERVAAASAASATSPTGFKRPSYSYDPPANTATVDAGMEDEATVISRVDEIASYFEANAWLSRHTPNSSKASRGRHSVSAGAVPPPPPPPPPLTQLTSSMSAPSQPDADLDLDTRIRRMIDSSDNSPAVPPHPKDGHSVTRHHQRHHARSGFGSSPLPPPPPPPPPSLLPPAGDTTQQRPQSRTSALPADLLAKRELIASKVAAKRAADRVAAAAAAAAGAVGGVLSSKQALSVPTGVKIDSLSKIPLPPSPPVTGKTAAGTENMALANGDDDDSDIYDLLGTEALHNYQTIHHYLFVDAPSLERSDGAWFCQGPFALRVFYLHASQVQRNLRQKALYVLPHAHTHPQGPLHWRDFNIP